MADDKILYKAAATPASGRAKPVPSTRQEYASIPVTIIMLSGLLLILVGMIYYTFIGPHPDASGSIQENPLNSLFWSDHPGISSIMIGLILWTVGYMIDRRSRTRGSSS